jgi:hypothetical protein
VGDALTRLVMPLHLGLAQPIDGELLAPTLENLRGRALIEPTVDLAPSSDTAALHVGNLGGAHGHGDTAVPVLLGDLVAREVRRGLQRQVRAFLDEQHIAAGLG